MALCCSNGPMSLGRRALLAALAWLPAIVFTDSALHYEGHGTGAVLTRWMAAGVWLLLAVVFTWRVFRPTRGQAGSAADGESGPGRA
jgi:hypothetical protein